MARIFLSEFKNAWRRMWKRAGATLARSRCVWKWKPPTTHPPNKHTRSQGSADRYQTPSSAATRRRPVARMPHSAGRLREARVAPGGGRRRGFAPQPTAAATHTTTPPAQATPSLAGELRKRAAPARVAMLATSGIRAIANRRNHFCGKPVAIGPQSYAKLRR